MTLNSKIMRDPPAARRLRRLAPLVILLMLAALIMVPGIVAEHDDDATFAATDGEALSGLAGFPLLLVAGLRRA